MVASVFGMAMFPRKHHCGRSLARVPGVVEVSCLSRLATAGSFLPSFLQVRSWGKCYEPIRWVSFVSTELDELWQVSSFMQLPKAWLGSTFSNFSGRTSGVYLEELISCLWPNLPSSYWCVEKGRTQELTTQCDFMCRAQ